MANLSNEAKRILKKSVEGYQEEKKKIQQDLSVVTRDIERNQARKRELEEKLSLIDLQTLDLNKDIDGK